jgi:hypothetical protein
MVARIQSRSFLFTERPHTGACPACGDHLVPVTLTRLVAQRDERSFELGPITAIHWLCRQCRRDAYDPLATALRHRATGD